MHLGTKNSSHHPNKSFEASSRSSTDLHDHGVLTLRQLQLLWPSIGGTKKALVLVIDHHELSHRKVGQNFKCFFLGPAIWAHLRLNGSFIQTILQAEGTEGDCAILF